MMFPGSSVPLLIGGAPLQHWCLLLLAVMVLAMMLLGFRR